METGRFGFAGSTTAQVYKGRYMDNRYGAGTAPSALRPLDFVLKKAPTHNVDISQDTGPFDIVKDEAVLVLRDAQRESQLRSPRSRLQTFFPKFGTQTSRAHQGLRTPCLLLASQGRGGSDILRREAGSPILGI